MKIYSFKNRTLIMLHLQYLYGLITYLIFGYQPEKKLRWQMEMRIREYDRWLLEIRRDIKKLEKRGDHKKARLYERMYDQGVTELTEQIIYKELCDLPQ